MLFQSHILATILEHTIELVSTLVMALTVRYLYGIAKPEDDYLWLCNRLEGLGFYRLKWYRGLEYLHQLRAKRILFA